jgi:oxygen-dependent protoporphyrinogen oxidase
VTKRIAIVGGGIAGVTAAWQLARLAEDGADVSAVLFEASARLGGIVETVREGGFTIECGPDAWVTEKPWARELAEELGLRGEIIASNDATRKTYVLVEGKLVAMPDGMRMMVPADLDALERSNLFSDGAKAAYRNEISCAAELKAAAPDHDESVAEFVGRHFGAEVLERIGAPLLSGVFGGDVAKLSVRAVMAPFVAMEREHGSLILALQRRIRESVAKPVFTTLRGGTGTLIDAMVKGIPRDWIRLRKPVLRVARTGAGWQVETASGWENFDGLMLATPVDVSRRLLAETDAVDGELMAMEASSAVLAGFGFTGKIDLPPGFGFLVPPGSTESSLLAGTFVDQKFDGRVPPGCRLLRGFFGGAVAERLLNASDEEIAGLARRELEAILGKLPESVVTIVRRWPRALPQYAVGHSERMAELFRQTEAAGSLWLLGNGYKGVGLPDLVRDARAAAAPAAGFRRSI